MTLATAVRLKALANRSIYCPSLPAALEQRLKKSAE